MKIRNGFVSNSSSSSFIIKFKKNKDLKEQINKMLDEVIDIEELKEDLSWYNFNLINEDEYIDEDEYNKVLLDSYKKYIFDDLYDSLSTPININSVKEDIELADKINNIDFEKYKLFNNKSLLDYRGNNKYIFNFNSAKEMINNTEYDYYNLTVSDHFREYSKYDGRLESWLYYNTKYIEVVVSNH